MKRLSAIFMIALILAGTSCKKLRSVNFDANFESNATIEAQQAANTTTTVQSQDITTNIASLVQSNNTRTDLLKSVRLGSLNCGITAPSGQTFSWLEDVRVLVATDVHSEREVASKHSVSNGGISLDLDCSDADLKDLLISNVLKVKVVVVNKEAVNSTINLKLKFKFHFEADLIAGAGL